MIFRPLEVEIEPKMEAVSSRCPYLLCTECRVNLRAYAADVWLNINRRNKMVATALYALT